MLFAIIKTVPKLIALGKIILVNLSLTTEIETRIVTPIFAENH